MAKAKYIDIDNDEDYARFRDMWNSKLRDVIQAGRPEDLMILRRHPDEIIRGWVAEYGRDEDLNVLRTDESSRVRYQVKLHNRPEDRPILAKVAAHSDNPYRRMDAIELGGDDILELLRKDSDWRVQAAVAKNGRPEDLEALRVSPNALVRESVADYGRAEDLDVLRDDPVWEVRYAVEKHEKSLEERAIDEDDLEEFIAQYDPRSVEVRLRLPDELADKEYMAFATYYKGYAFSASEGFILDKDKNTVFEWDPGDGYPSYTFYSGPSHTAYSYEYGSNLGMDSLDNEDAIGFFMSEYKKNPDNSEKYGQHGPCHSEWDFDVYGLGIAIEEVSKSVELTNEDHEITNNGKDER